MDRTQARHFEDADMIMGLYVREYFDPFRPDDLINKLIDRCCTIRQNISQPLLAPSRDRDVPVNLNQCRETMTLVGVITGCVEMRFTQHSAILEAGEMMFMPPHSDYLVLPTIDTENSNDRKYEARIIYAEYPSKINYF